MTQIKDRLMSERFGLPVEPVHFLLPAGLAFCSREPYKSAALQLESGQPILLCRESANRQESQAIRIDTLSGQTVGFLYAAEAAFLSILLDYCRTVELRRQQQSGAFQPELADLSIIRSILTRPQPDDRTASRLRYPKISLQIHLYLRQAWPIFTILAILHLKSENGGPLPFLTDNPWLQPIARLQADYRRGGHDNFRLPQLLTEAWIELTRQETI